MKGWAVVILIFAVLTGAICSFAYFIAIPKMAAALVPTKWQQLTLGKPESAYESFLGSPVIKDSSLYEKTTWIERNGNYTYTLLIAYNKDTVAIMKSVHYHFSNWLFTKEENIAADSLQQAIY